jgi:hypothetical protein
MEIEHLPFALYRYPSASAWVSRGKSLLDFDYQEGSLNAISRTPIRSDSHKAPDLEKPVHITSTNKDHIWRPHLSHHDVAHPTKQWAFRSQACISVDPGLHFINQADSGNAAALFSLSQTPIICDAIHCVRSSFEYEMIRPCIYWRKNCWIRAKSRLHSRRWLYLTTATFRIANDTRVSWRSYNSIWYALWVAAATTAIWGRPIVHQISHRPCDNTSRRVGIQWFARSISSYGKNGYRWWRQLHRAHSYPGSGFRRGSWSPSNTVRGQALSCR